MNDEWNGPNGQSCGNCFFWIYMACCRRPPTVLALAADEDGRVSYELQRPETGPEEWCGEWKGRG